MRSSQEKRTTILEISKSDWYKSENFFQETSRKMFYKVEGKGEPLLCIHGFPTSSWDFAPIWSSLIKKFKVITIDLLGLGASDKLLESLKIMDQADIIEKLLIELNINEGHILAHDLGDTVAQELLARMKDGSSSIKWKSCVLMNGGIFPDGNNPRLIQKLLISPVGPLVAKLSSSRTFKRNMINIFSKEHPPSKEFLDDSWLLLVQNGGRKSISKLIQYMNERVLHKTRWLHSIQESKIPIRLINGLQDPVSGIAMVNMYNKLIPNPDVIKIEDAGHYPHVEVPDKVLDAFYQFHAI